jgi:hypothetical protein
MRRFALVLALFVAGCAKPAAPRVVPLSVADWRALSPGDKYTPATLERLKAGDPTLETPEGWEAFSKTTLARERRKDFPKGRR